jgi:hypothetical protein
MLSPSRLSSLSSLSSLSLNIPESPIEKQAFRSRSFRRIILTACALSLFIATIHSISVKNELRRELALDYLKFRRNASPSGWLSSLQSVDKPQVSFDTAEDEGADDVPFSIDELMKQLPEVIRIPLEEAVEDVVLEGWEDEWFSSATYDYDRKIEEPKLDFVYNCKSLALRPVNSDSSEQGSTVRKTNSRASNTNTSSPLHSTTQRANGFLSTASIATEIGTS